VVRRYRPFLDELDLTYTQYIVMLVLWEENEKSVHDLGERLFLDSGTLTPVLKSLEAKGYLTRRRSKADERVLLVALTDEGQALKESAAEIPQKMSACVTLEPQEAATLYSLLYKMLGQF
jgi:DNA-binding MarR family transcriptional regulator